MITSPPEQRIGSQRPRLSSIPPFFSSLGQDAVDFAEYAGLTLDPWQAYVLENSLNLRAGGKWAAMEVGLLVPRQNGKGGVIEARQLAAMFLTKDPEIIYSAHQMKTSKKMYARIKRLCENTPELDRQIKGRYRQSNETMGIELDWGMLQFVARAGGSGRGFTGNTLFFDEAFDLDPEMLAELIPALAAVPNAQVWYVSSAGKRTSEALAKIRARGIAKDRLLAFFEWSAEKGADLDNDDDALYACNPAMGLRLDYDYVRVVERGQMPDDELFGRERFGIWHEPERERERIVDMALWGTMTNASPNFVGTVAIGVDASWDQKWWTISAARRTDDGRVHLEIGYHKEASKAEVLKEIKRLRDKWNPCAVVIDKKSPANILERDLINAGIEPEMTTAAQMVTACLGFYNDAINGVLSHVGGEILAPDSEKEPTFGDVLTTALDGAEKRSLSGGWAIERQSGELLVSPLIAAVGARWGLIEFGATPKPPAQTPTQTEAADVAEVDALMSAGF